MNFAEVRHLDEIKGNFSIFDGIYYRAGAKSATSSPPRASLVSHPNEIAELILNATKGIK